MSQDTASAIAEAKAQEAEQRRIVDELKQQCLDAVATGIPAGAEKYAKKIAHQQPEITKSLDRAGVDALRKEILEAAEALAAEVREAADAIKWPGSGSRRDGVATALFYFLDGPRIGRFDAILRRSGFNIGEHADLNPHNIYDLRQFKELDTQISVLAAKQQIVAAAVAAHDRNIVDDLWGD